MRFALTIALLLVAAPAAAQEPPAMPPPPAESSAPASTQPQTEEQVEAEVLFDRGREHFTGSHFAVAAAHFRAALDLDPDHERARAYLVECLVVEGDLEGAQRVAAGPTPAVPGEVTSPLPGGMSEQEAALRRAEAAAKQAEAQARHAEQASARQAEEDAHRAAEEAERAEIARRRAKTQAAASSPQAKKARRQRLNPRAQDHFSVALALGGSTITVGGVFEVRPHWLASVNFGFGGFLVPLDGAFGRDVVGAAAFSAEGQFTPIPFRLTPVFGGGVIVLGGPGARSIDGTLWSPIDSGNGRVVPYGLLGARYDLRKSLWVSLSVRLAASRNGWPMPLPGGRIGLRF
ncbi:MAG: tetratricopeptide repeat protein [Deltaproteobacteria bacterium]|nr:tetratricopeptide repeat protein [Deltaproteobacteria bacterium]